MPEVLAPIVPLSFEYDDGGRADAGYRGRTNDCVVRALAIATGYPYKQLYQMFKKPNPGNVKGISPYSSGVQRRFTHTFLTERGWTGVPLYHDLGTFQRFDRTLPSGKIVVALPGHLTCVINRVIHDTYPSKTSTVVDYMWIKEDD